MKQVCISLCLLLGSGLTFGQEQERWIREDSCSYKLVDKNNLLILETWKRTTEKRTSDSLRLETITEQLVYTENLDSSANRFSFADIVEMRKNPDSAIELRDRIIPLREFSRPISVKNFFYPYSTETIPAGMYADGKFFDTPIVNRKEYFNWPFVFFLIGFLHWIYLMVVKRKGEINKRSFQNHVLVQIVLVILGTMMFLTIANVWMIPTLVITMIVGYIDIRCLIKRHLVD